MAHFPDEEVEARSGSGCMQSSRAYKHTLEHICTHMSSWEDRLGYTLSSITSSLVVTLCSRIL